MSWPIQQKLNINKNKLFIKINEGPRVADIK